MAKANEYGIMKAPDGFYLSKKNKSGMLSSDSRKITDEEIIEMFLDVLKRNKAETGRDVMTIFSKRVPVLMAKLNPDIRETGILPKPRLTPQQIQMLRQQQMMQQARNTRVPYMRIEPHGEPQS